VIFSSLKSTSLADLPKASATAMKRHAARSRGDQKSKSSREAGQPQQDKHYAVIRGTVVNGSPAIELRMKGWTHMGKGLKLVEEAIVAQFGVKDLEPIPGNGTADSGFVFKVRFCVYVSAEWDNNPGHFKVDLSQLGKELRASKNGKVRVKTDGIFPE
jgi:hypothetical protein